MKKFFFLVLILTLFPLSSHAQNRYGPPISEEEKARQEEIKKKTQEIEIIEDTPARPFKKIQPLWEYGYSIEGALKKAKKKAAKLGADAIIEFKTSTQKQDVYTWLGGGSSSYPIVEGWAVKWE